MGIEPTASPNDSTVEDICRRRAAVRCVMSREIIHEVKNYVNGGQVMVEKVGLSSFSFVLTLIRDFHCFHS